MLTTAVLLFAFEEDAAEEGEDSDVDEAVIDPVCLRVLPMFRSKRTLPNALN